MVPDLQLDQSSTAPLYRQLRDQLRSAILDGRLRAGERLPATRELAGQLGLNRTTVSAAYDLLTEDGLVNGHVGRGSFVTHAANHTPPRPEPELSFASSRPSELLFPIEEFRRTCAEVMASPELASILQLGTPLGYAPLRRYLADQARDEGTASASDDILITNGCQQALDLICRALTSAGDTVAVEDPVYPGLKNVFAAGGVRVVGIPMGPDGVDHESAARVVANERPRLLVVTPSFQNPTGATLPVTARERLLRIAREAGVTIVENDIYGELRYRGLPVETIKQLDSSGGTILLRSFSKTAFPGLRVGWTVAPRETIRRLAEAKQCCDLHTGHLSQAVLLRFAESGRLAEHRARMIEAGRERLDAVLGSLRRHLGSGAAFTRPQGGMSVWVTLDGCIDTSALLPMAQREGVAYLPGRYFGVSREHRSSARLSFAGLAPARIEKGVAILARIFAEAARPVESDFEPALV